MSVYVEYLYNLLKSLKETGKIEDISKLNHNLENTDDLSLLLSSYILLKNNFLSYDEKIDLLNKVKAVYNNLSENYDKKHGKTL